MLFFTIYLLFLPILFAYDCEDICYVTITVQENVLLENLQWNLIDLLTNRTKLANSFQYSLSNPSDYFEIQSPLLKYRLNQLDREQICRHDPCQLGLQIFTQTSFVILFKLIILDDNDWKPWFKKNSVDLNIRENLSINYRLQLPIAYDYDSIQYNIDHYEFINNTDEIDRIFQLEEISNEELRLKLLKTLDCETKNNYQLFIIAIDKGGLKSNILHVNITVGDLNEYQPRFSQRLYHTSIPENFPVVNSSSSPILQIIATDDDCDDKIIHYSIINNEIPEDVFPLVIDKYTGLIRVQFQLDYERITTYRFRVKASNLDEITSSIVPVIIHVIDVNDNQPLIYMNILNEYKSNENKENLTINIRENSPQGQVLGTVLIRDSDSAMINRQLSLDILSCTNCPVGLESQMDSATTYLIRTARVLDREVDNEQVIIVFEARDYGDPSLSSQYRLIVNVIDENDCVPKFTQEIYQFRIPTSSTIGTFIGQVEAIDNDYSPNFHLIQYKLRENDDQNLFNIDPNNGSLFLISPLSTKIEFNMTVTAIDRDNPLLYDQTIIQILFYDIITCVPSFNQSIYVFNTTEHQIIPYNIGQVTANDCLQSSTPTSYQLIIEEDLSFPFSLDHDTGIIKVIRELDREIKSFYKFSINLINSTIQTDIHINILDINDHHPIFNQSYEQYIYITIGYSETKPIFITNIYATDADTDLNGLVHYYFRNRDFSNYFHLYSNGSLFLYKPTDVSLPIRLEIYARDHGYPNALDSKQNLVIYICDMFKRDECSSNSFQRSFFLGSIFILLSVISFVFIIIICIFWNIYLKEHLREKRTKRSYNCRIEARKSLINPV